MEKKLQELQQEDINAESNFEHIKNKVEDGSYFADALDWYFFRYVNAICDRTILIVGGLIAAIVFYFLIEMINSAFPLKVEEPIFIRSYDQSLYFPNLLHLKPKVGEAGYDKNIKTVDQAVLKYLISTYIKDREGYDFSEAEVGDVNLKFAHIKNISSEMEYRKFQLFMSKDNQESPIHDFGLNVKKKIEIKSVKFITKQASNFANRAIDFITGKVPSQAEVRFVATTTKTNENEEINTSLQEYLVKISFTFNGITKPEPTIRNVIKFVVNDYQLFKVN